MIIPEGFAEASIYVWVAGDAEVTVSTWGFTKFPVSDFDQADCDAVYTAFATALRDSRLGTQARFGGVTLRANNGAGIVLFENIFETPGENDIALAPINCCALIQKRTALGGRHGRGRCYMAGFLDASQVDSAGNLSEDLQTALTVNFTEFFNELIAAEMIPMLLHADATAPTQITSLSCANKIATQRRRVRP